MPLSFQATWYVPERAKIWPDVGDAGALLAGGERLGHPGDRVVGLALGQHGLRHDVDAALEQLHVEALLLVEALIDAAM
jgi:hypothetical protein